jgi:hypothetical protein
MRKKFQIKGHSEPAPTSALWRMDDKWSQNSFSVGFQFLANHGGQLFYYLPTNILWVISR